MGSRGSRSFEQNGAQPMTRSANPAPQAAVPSTSPMGAAAAAGGGSFFQRHPFLTGIAGGSSLDAVQQYGRHWAMQWAAY